MNRLRQINDELRALDVRRAELIHERDKLLTARTEPILSPKAPGRPLSPGEKIALFLSLFRCREDVYPKLWENVKTGRKGYSPVCRNEWVRGVCEKPRVKCAECSHQAFLPLDERAVRDHLTGKAVIGTYAIRADNSCVFLAADFDGSGWKEDIRAYRDAARSLGVEVAVERSRSGDGGHAWVFFAEPVPASLARRLGTIIMAKATTLRPTLPLRSYDRFFPNQDTLPTGGFGNLIALPLQARARELGHTLFLDDSLNPHADPWQYLTDVPKIDSARITSCLARALPEVSEEAGLCFEDRALDIIPALVKKGDFTSTVRAVRRAQLEISLAALPANLVAALRRLATLANPEFFEKLRLRFGTWNIPRFIFCGELHEDGIALPRGTIDAALKLIRKAGGHVEVHDRRPAAVVADFDFLGTLTPDQRTAVDELCRHEEGILVAPPGAGKTVMACAILAARGVSTLVLVHRKSLLEQWRARLSEFLGLGKKEIGVLSATGVRGSPRVVLGMIQTLAKSVNPGALFAPYTQVVIDECHHVPAASFEAVMKACPARFVLGLTATPTRKDGLQKILFFQCGPIRHRMGNAGDSGLKRVLLLRDVSLGLPPEELHMPMHSLCALLAHHEERNRLVARDIIDALNENRRCIVLSERKEHLAILGAILPSMDARAAERVFRIDGSMGKKARAAALAKLEGLASSGQGFALLATSSLIGEGFDLPELDTLFLTLPISFKGRVIQYAGRLHRAHKGKDEVRIYDYAEPDHPLSAHMRRKRRTAYREMAYRTEDESAQLL